MMDLLSPAKINLFLKVTGKRPDGYHTLTSLICPIGLFDSITIAFGTPEIRVYCSNPDIPQDHQNLAHKAARLFLEKLNITAGVDIAIQKKIPAGAGLGGGSSNAASVLLGLNRYYHNPLSLETLSDIGLSIGADVPFFLYQKPALASGIGETLETYGKLPVYPVVLVFPGFSVSTEMVYNNLNLGLTKCKKTITCSLLKQHGFDAEHHLCNDLESVTISLHPVISTIKKMLLAQGAIGTLMSGSGPTVFGIFSDPGRAQKAVDVLSENENWQVFLADMLI